MPGWFYAPAPQPVQIPPPWAPTAPVQTPPPPYRQLDGFLSAYLAPRESWLAQAGQRTAAAFSVPVQPLNYPFPARQAQLNVRAAWTPDYWYAQSEPGIASGLASAVPPAAAPPVPVNLYTIVSAPRETWPTQRLPQTAGSFQLPVTALPAPVPQWQAWQWPRDSWPAQTAARGAPAFATTPAPQPYVNVRLLASIRSGWPEANWAAQRGAQIGVFGAAFQPPYPKPQTQWQPWQWPRESWGAQAAPVVASWAASPFVPPPSGFWVQAVTKGIYNNVVYEPGDVFRIQNAGDFSDASVNYGPASGTVQLGWMQRIGPAANEFQYDATVQPPSFPVADPKRKFIF